MPSYTAAGNNMKSNPKTHAKMIIFCTVAALNVCGFARIDKYFSRLMTTRLLIVMAGNMKLRYRTSLHAQPLWKTSNKISMHIKGSETVQQSMSDRDMLLTYKSKFLQNGFFGLDFFLAFSKERKVADSFPRILSHQ